MAWLARLLRFVPKQEREGISLDWRGAWEITGVRSFAGFLRALPSLFPRGSILYLEGTSISTEVCSFLSERRAPDATKVEMATIWPRPKVFHLALTAENMAILADLCESSHVVEICDHLHVYHQGKVLMQGYDAFDMTFVVSPDVPVQRLEAFCQELGCSYKRLEETGARA